uniref:Tetraspanin n=1 Tax=Monopterus albus TaxID=43700 RepID=A0A3Q3J1H1_MONAL|nr:tetraspanin-8-like [Monopterus albus]
MAQVNTCLKRIFTIFNLFFAIVGGVIILLALLSQFFTSANGGENLEGRTSGLIVLYVAGIVTLVISILGAYGAHKESRVCLIVFLVCMVIGCLLMLRVGVPIAFARPELKGWMEEKLRSVLPLDKASDNVKNTADGLQAGLHCCGLFSYQDWEDNIPDSRLCSSQEEEEMCQAVGYRMLLRETRVYSRPCFPIIMHYILLVVDVMLGIFFTMAALALLGMILSSIMIHQMNSGSRPTMMLTVPTIFSTPPPKYQELHNPPPY